MSLKHCSFLSVLFLVVSGCWDEGSGGGRDEDPQDPVGNELDTTISMSGSSLSGIYGDPLRAFVYVADKLQNKVHIIDTTTKSISKSIDVGSMPTQMDTTADGSLCWSCIRERGVSA
jgi:YVTN family beta-propeller protein